MLFQGFKPSIILKTDQYKANSHWNMLPNDVLAVDSYDEARNGAKYNEIVFTGLQSILLKDFVGPVFNQDDIEYADFILENSNFHPDYFNKESWERMLKKHGGRLPLKITALPEGTITNPGSAWFTIEGMDDEFPWLSQRCESRLLHSWYPTVIATRSRETIKVIKKWIKMSSDMDEEFARHLFVDFGYRGCSCDEQAAIGGTAHAINSYASDTILALHEIHQYYGGLGEKGVILYSVPATEHAISQYYGLDEDRYLMDMLEKYPNWILSLVADTNNIEKFVDVIIRNRKNEIVARWQNGKAPVNKLVIRPDSLRFEGDTPSDQVVWIFQKLEDIFGVSFNKKGYKVLHPCVGVLWGDGISDAEIAGLYKAVANAGYSVESLVVGQGGGLLVKDANRDTLRVALKASSQKRKDIGWVDVIKNPLDKSKKSKSGRLSVIINKQGILETVNQTDSRYFSYPNQMVTVFEMGELKQFYNFADIRKRAA